MRFLVRVHLPVEEGNNMVKDPKGIKKLEAYYKKIRAEAAYFYEDGGERTMAFIVDLPSAHMIPVIAEPMFQEFNAKVEFHPVMILEDLKKGFSMMKK
ncbi:MAG: hypothetical protein ACRD90_03980 [Nitrosopumilaceae archaeon]